jgi:hypothetical protein
VRARRVSCDLAARRRQVVHRPWRRLRWPVYERDARRCRNADRARTERGPPRQHAFVHRCGMQRVAFAFREARRRSSHPHGRCCPVGEAQGLLSSAARSPDNPVAARVKTALYYHRVGRPCESRPELLRGSLERGRLQSGKLRALTHLPRKRETGGDNARFRFVLRAA